MQTKLYYEQPAVGHGKLAKLCVVRARSARPRTTKLTAGCIAKVGLGAVAEALSVDRLQRAVGERESAV